MFGLLEAIDMVASDIAGTADKIATTLTKAAAHTVDSLNRLMEVRIILNNNDRFPGGQMAAGREPAEVITMSNGTQTIGRIIAGLLAAIALPLTTATPAAAKSPRQQPWHLDQIGVPAAHAVTQGEGVLVGMFIEDAVDVDHPELAGRVRPAKYAGQFGRIGPIPAELRRSAEPEVDTGLAGLVVASGSDGPVGVAPRAEVQPIRVTYGEDRVSAALRWLVDEGAKVIDMSGGFRVEADTRGVDGIRYALAKDVVVILDANSADDLPDDLTTGVLVVGGVDQEGKRWLGGSNDGPINLSAPGDAYGLIGITGSIRGGQYVLTSNADRQACAIVAGVVALIRSHHPELNAASVIDRLLATARDIGPPGKDSEYGAGIVNAAAAVTADRPPVTKNPLGDPGPPDSLLDRLTSPVALIAGAVCCLIVTTLAIALLIFLWARRRR